MKSCFESQMENLSVSTFDDNALDLENQCLVLARVVIDPGSDQSVNKVNQNRSIVNIIDRPVSGEP